MNAIEELGEVVKLEDKGERVLAFAGWVARWVEVGFVQSDFDLKTARQLRDAARSDVAQRAKEDRAALAAFLTHLAVDRDDVFSLDDQGIVHAPANPDGSKRLAYRSLLQIVILLARPHELEQPTPEAGRFFS